MSESETERAVENFELRRAVRGAFSPTAPISQRDLFAGRTQQMWQVIEGVDEPGQHLILFGERGVGKTSLASVSTQLVGNESISVKVNCHSGDTFDDIWRRIFSEITYLEQRPGTGFQTPPSQVMKTVADGLGEVVASDDVQRLLRMLTSNGQRAVIFIDEFDTVGNREVQRQFADCIKALSDQVVPATIVLVGVAESVEQLILEHASVERALVQINMPRMSEDELAQIVQNGLSSVSMGIDNEALEHITGLSQGLPHYTHLLAQHAALSAFDEGSAMVTQSHVNEAMNEAVSRSQESIAQQYYNATYSARENLYKQVLLACACARSDDRGFFTAASVRESLSVILDRPMEIPQFAMHLNAFSTDRGPVLRKVGVRKRFRYRFTNPLLQPYVLMKGLAEGGLTNRAMMKIRSSSD